MPQETHVAYTATVSELHRHRVLEEADPGAKVHTEPVLPQDQLTPPTLPDDQLARQPLRETLEITECGAGGRGRDNPGQVIRQLDKEEVRVTGRQKLCGTVGDFRFCRW